MSRRTRFAAVLLAGLVSGPVSAADCYIYWSEVDALTFNGSTVEFQGAAGGDPGTDGDQGTCQVTWQGDSGGNFVCDGRRDTSFALLASSEDDGKPPLAAWDQVFYAEPCLGAQQGQEARPG